MKCTFGEMLNQIFFSRTAWRRMSGKKPKKDKSAAAESASSEISECKYTNYSDFCDSYIGS
jgi:hypothetical protein